MLSRVLDNSGRLINKFLDPQRTDFMDYENIDLTIFPKNLKQQIIKQSISSYNSRENPPKNIHLGMKTSFSSSKRLFTFSVAGLISY